MLRDSTLDAASREAYLKETEHLRKRDLTIQQLERHRDFHERMITEIVRLRQREERARDRKLRRKKAWRAEKYARDYAAACQIQRIARGLVYRARYRKLRWQEYRYPRYFLANGAPRNLANFSLGYRENFERNAVKIQLCSRRFLANAKVSRRVAALQTLQRFFRDRVWRMRRKRFKNGLVKLQAAFRRRVVLLALSDGMIDIEVEREREREQEQELEQQKQRAAERSRKNKPWLKHSSMKKSPAVSSGKHKSITKSTKRGFGRTTTTTHEHDMSAHSNKSDIDGVLADEVQTSEDRPRIRIAHWPPELIRARQHKKNRSRAALSLQRTYRGFISRRSLSKGSKQTASKGTLERQNRASLSIQKQFRASRAARKEKELQNHASRSIQKQFRASREARKEKELREQASRSIQRHFRASRVLKKQQGALANEVSDNYEDDYEEEVQDDEDVYSLDEFEAEE
jgi:hypothetical protein